MNKFIFGISLTALSLSSIGASFDCSKARTQVEKAICSDAELSQLDEEMAVKYKIALKDHPVFNFVKTYQRNWLKDNSSCNSKNLVGCLKDSYKTRILQLSDIENTKIYSNSEKFDYENGDVVAEIKQLSGNQYLFSLWGAARIHRQASTDNGKSMYTDCNFIGTVDSISGGKAVNKSGESFTFKIIGKNMVYKDDSPSFCQGFASLPESMTLIEKQRR